VVLYPGSRHLPDALRWFGFCPQKSFDLSHLSAPNFSALVQALCSGGDVKKVVLDAEKGKWQPGVEFFRAENTLDYLISRLADGNMTNGRPCIAQVAIMDGIVMGGGAGLAMHAQFRVATEKYATNVGQCFEKHVAILFSSL
jgi:hypothetical protein